MPCRDIIENRMAEMCSADRLKSEIGDILVLDCRGQNEFTESHVDSAINITLPSLMLRRLKKGNLNISSVIQSNDGKEKFQTSSKTHKIILYDDCKDSNLNQNSVVCLLAHRLKEDGCRVEILEGGFETFHNIYPEYCRTNNMREEDESILGLKNITISEVENPDSGIGMNSMTFPVEVLPYLYLGNAKTSADKDTLKKHGIQYILNVTPNIPNVFEDEDFIEYKRIPISDHWSQNLSVHFPQAIKFIDEARAKKSGVLVHCLAGISRSVTVTVAYLMSKMSLSLNDAYDYVKKCKPNISPNFNFMGQLLDFEQHLLGARTPEECTCKDEVVCTCCETKMYFMTPTKTQGGFDLEEVL